MIRQVLADEVNALAGSPRPLHPLGWPAATTPYINKSSCVLHALKRCAPAIIGVLHATRSPRSFFSSAPFNNGAPTRYFSFPTFRWRVGFVCPAVVVVGPFARGWSVRQGERLLSLLVKRCLTSSLFLCMCNKWRGEGESNFPLAVTAGFVFVLQPLPQWTQRRVP